MTRKRIIPLALFIMIGGGVLYFLYEKLNNPRNLYESFIDSYPESGLMPLSIDYSKDELYFNLESASFYLLTQNEHNRAKRFIKSVLANNPDHAIALNNLAGLEAIEWDFEKSLSYLEKAKEKAEDDEVLNIRYFFVIQGAIFNFFLSTQGSISNIELIDGGNRFFANGTGAAGYLYRGVKKDRHLLEPEIEANSEAVERMMEN